MTDWLMSDDSDGGGYLGMDDPAMPDSAPAPPSAPTATLPHDDASAGDWLGGSGADAESDAGWLGDAPQPMQSAGGAPVMDGQGDWMSGEHGGAQQQAVTPGHVQHQQHDPYAQQHQHHQEAAPMAMSHGGGTMVMQPQLQQVHADSRPAGTGTRGELSGLVLDVEVQVEVGLGAAALTVEEFLEMGRGSVVELDTPIDAPIELKVRGKLIARGQLVSINGSYGMRIVEMLDEEH